ncbi:MAG: sigma-70 family RNA polymerase sigma factor [Planctomycetota bacterium]|nr:sigma-70 family RNA polymerase sigma factor [Planctomycetota bacterium]
MSAEAEPVGSLVDGLFRREAGRLVARLARQLGAARLELAEDAVQEALLAALRTWSIRGVPQDPRAWLARAARNAALDRLRGQRESTAEAEVLERWNDEEPRDPDALEDSELAMLFACAHPALAREARVALMLNAVAGFAAAEIARLGLESESAVAQRLVRAKAKLRDEELRLETPRGAELAERLEGVLDAVYGMLTEGLSAHRGEELVRADVVRAALRLALELARDPRTATPRSHALAALALFHAARVPARTDAAGGPLLLEEQDRGRWDRKLIALGFAQLSLAASGDELSELHIEAGIASQHALARTWDDTDWQAILHWYDLLAERNASPVVRLNRAVALAKVHGAGARSGAERALLERKLARARTP